MPTVDPLIAIFEEARAWVAHPDNDFSWSSWIDGNDAVQELDSLLMTLRAGKRPAQGHMEVLFAPTGPMQEVSLSSGWGQEFLALAQRFDAALSVDPTADP